MKSIIEKHGATIEIISPFDFGGTNKQTEDATLGTCFVIFWETIAE